MLDPLIINETIVIPAADLTWVAARSSGAGGQNVNKVSSKVELRFNLETCELLSEPVRTRLRGLVKNHLDADGWLIIVSQTTRDQRRNLDIALERLRELILKALEVPKIRRPTRPTRSSQTRRLDGKRIDAKRKQSRRVSPSEE
ncbi:MAG: alternative ribosome rescue aminoacyl-tRNA hydrolase ArfB [Candidatus Ozemobacteraceae bacterium]